MLAAFGVFNSVISVYYYFGVLRQVFFVRGTDESPIRTSAVMNAVVMVALVITLVIGLYAQPFIRLANNSAQILAAAF